MPPTAQGILTINALTQTSALHVQPRGRNVLVRNVLPAANECDRPGQRDESGVNLATDIGVGYDAMSGHAAIAPGLSASNVVGNVEIDWTSSCVVCIRIGSVPDTSGV